jgi:hypothetical protein
MSFRQSYNKGGRWNSTVCIIFDEVGGWDAPDPIDLQFTGTMTRTFR